MALKEFLSVVVLLICSTDGNVLSMSSRPPKRPLVIAHRGSSGVLPEHTIEAYERAISDGADVIECDVTLSKDLVPVCLHEELLQVTTDVPDRPEFNNRRRSITVLVGDRQVRQVICTLSRLCNHVVVFDVKSFLNSMFDMLTSPTSGTIRQCWVMKHLSFLPSKNVSD